MWTISLALGDVPVCMCVCVCVYKLRHCTTKIWKILEEARHLLLWWSLEPTSRTRECSKFQGMDISILLRYYMTLLAVLLYIWRLATLVSGWRRHVGFNAATASEASKACNWKILEDLGSLVPGFGIAQQLPATAIISKKHLDSMPGLIWPRQHTKASKASEASKASDAFIAKNKAMTCNNNCGDVCALSHPLRYLRWEVLLKAWKIVPALRFFWNLLDGFWESLFSFTENSCQVTLREWFRQAAWPCKEVQQSTI